MPRRARRLTRRLKRIIFWGGEAYVGPTPQGSDSADTHASDGAGEVGQGRVVKGKSKGKGRAEPRPLIVAPVRPFKVSSDAIVDADAMRLSMPMRCDC